MVLSFTVRMAQRIRKARERRKMTQEVLAAKAGISREYLARLETGRQDPRVSVVVKLARALNATLTELVEKPEEGERTMPIPNLKTRKNWNQQVKRQIDLLTKVIDWTTGLQDEAEEHKDWFTARAARRVVPYLRLAEAELYDLQYFEDEEWRRKWRRGGLDLDD